MSIAAWVPVAMVKQFAAVGEQGVESFLALLGQREQIARILRAQQFDHRGIRLFQRSTGSAQIEGKDFFRAFDGLGGDILEESQLGFDLRLAYCGKLFGKRTHRGSLEVFMTRCNKIQSIPTGKRLKSIFAQFS
ncbi:hypothetical protein LP419_27370 [Massilia sp. H-1]|nr:hypothetical protein LP419_27370 [Massilia sp. H-1]